MSRAKHAGLYPTPFGVLLQAARNRAGLSCRALAKALNLSHVYVGAVERGQVRALPRDAWAALCSALPELTLEQLDQAAAMSTTVHVDVRCYPSEVQPLMLQLVQAVAAGQVTAASAEALLAELN